MANKKISLNFIDIFSGAGGLSCGLELAGHKCLLGVDMDKNAIETFKLNHKHANVFCDSITKLTKSKLDHLTFNRPIHAVVGGPPCQGFSTVGIGNPNDKRNFLFKEFVRIVKLTNPYFVIIENVTGLLAKKNQKTVQEIFKLFSKMGYSLDIQVMSSEQYSVPEKRRRTIIIGSRINDQIIFPSPAKKLNTVGDAFKNLKAKDGRIYNHDLKSAKLKSKIDLERLMHIPEGAGIRYEKDEKKFLRNKKLKLNIDWSKLPENRFRQTKYQRLHRNLPSPTIMTHRHNYFHPVEHRYLTPREAAAIQSFPNDFKFTGPLSSQWRQIGNAVPPLLSKAIGDTLTAMYSLKKKKQKNISNKVKFIEVRKKAFNYKTNN